MATSSPPIAEAPLSGQLRCGEHTDNGTLTMVLQSEHPGGIEVKSVDGDWVVVPANSEAYVVNIGDLLARWTNGRWVSTVHRVGNASDWKSQKGTRDSVVFFHQPALDVTIDALPTCVGRETPAKYPPITLREHFSSQQKKLATRDASAVQAV
jgi:isopenicillin N synthase-like dioxygenase